MLELIERLEKAEGPSIALEAEICWTLERDRAVAAYWRGAMGKPGPLPDEFSRLPRGLGMASMEAGSPNYTTSLDAALALAERVLPGCFPWVGRNRGENVSPWSCDLTVGVNRRDSDSFEGDAATAALATCIAILKAKST